MRKAFFREVLTAFVMAALMVGLVFLLAEALALVTRGV